MGGLCVEKGAMIVDDELEEEVVDGFNVHLFVQIFIALYLPFALNYHPHRHP